MPEGVARRGLVWSVAALTPRFLDGRATGRVDPTVGWKRLVRARKSAMCSHAEHARLAEGQHVAASLLAIFGSGCTQKQPVTLRDGARAELG